MAHLKQSSRLWRPVTLTLGAGLLAFSLAGTAFAQSVVGNTAIGGKRVELLDDNTWRYVEAGSTATEGCAPLKNDVYFCGSNSDWQHITNAPPQITAAYRYSDTEYGQFVVEGLGADAGLAYEGMREIVLGYAGQAAGIPAASVPVLAEEDSTLDGRAAKTLVYAVKVQGLNFVFANTILIEKNRTIQAMTYKLGTEYADENKALHENFLALIKLDDQN